MFSFCDKCAAGTSSGFSEEFRREMRVLLILGSVAEKRGEGKAGGIWVSMSHASSTSAARSPVGSLVRAPCSGERKAYAHALAWRRAPLLQQHAGMRS